MRVELPRHRQLHSGPRQELPQVPHELTDPGFPEEFPRMVRGDPPVDGEVDGPLPILLVVEGHQVPEGEAPPGSLDPDILLGEVSVGKVQPGGLRHPAVTST